MNDDPEMWKEQQRFYNFLQHYDLHKYHQKFLAEGVSRISHLKALDDKDLEEIGLSRPERNRLFKKLDENFSLPGLIKVSLSCCHPDLGYNSLAPWGANGLCTIYTLRLNWVEEG